MARTSIAASGSDPTTITLTRLLTRLHQTLIIPNEATETKLHTSSIEREKLGTSIEYANGLLLELEQEALNIKNPNKKQETQAELFKKRELILRLEERLGEYEDVGNDDQALEEEGDASEGEDLLGADTPSSSPSRASAPSPTQTPEPISPIDSQPPIQSQPRPQTETESTLRARNPTLFEARSELLGTSSATSTGPPITSTTEALLTHNRTEQEALTTSLLNMAAALKSSSKAFSSSLESEKDIVDRAAEGMDKNTTGLEQASRKMGMLRSMSEGKGWWGRILLYAWIAGLAVLAFALVFVGPKLRF
ncbi:hypothetical protein LHYA1_G004652 [Lachnellula hyalina]|uniref:Synaptobrevin n=1 Tax=Lachnellula hyalina TaxID=1316788 RepID=A0A8H8R3U9_9HELO|nr:uncharacterized protein LHYA1_G004652 [Lachnellula hyalina]TVY27200.1 hypothetical protein LHYA1_G004652 [Lachnellula hyalina]